VSQKELAEGTGLSQASIHKYLNGSIPGSAELGRMADFFKVSADFLLGRTDQADLPKLIPRHGGGPYWGTSKSAPIISWASAGSSHDYADQGQDVPHVATDCRDPNCYALAIEGDSMATVYLPGDIIVAAPNTEPVQGDLVVAKTVKDEVYFKRLEFSRDREIMRLLSFNPNYMPMEFRREELQFIHPIFQVIRFLLQKKFVR
jgi:transcriptional regulator with XRE-family HTH domain